MRAGTNLFLIVVLLFTAASAVSARDEPHAILKISPVEATVGDRLQAELSVLLAPNERLVTGAIGPRLGPFVVSDGVWSGPSPEGTKQRWTWTGSLVSFRTGGLEVPSIRLGFERTDGASGTAESEPVRVEVRTVLSPEELEEDEIPELSGLKPPASLLPDYTGLWTAGALLALLLVLALVAWWLQRRFASKLARIDLPDDRFQRVPPHVWVHEALQELLDRRLVEQDQIDTFFMELSRIVKLYLGGRYRIDLLERTSREVPAVLEQAHTPAGSITQTRGLLDLADRVKFAGEQPEPQECRHAVESAYEIVEATRPIEEPEPLEQRGAA